MTERKSRPPSLLEKPLSRAWARLSGTDPKELADAAAGEVLQQRQQAQKHRDEVRKELKDGARPREGRFRL